MSKIDELRVKYNDNDVKVFMHVIKEVFKLLNITYDDVAKELGISRQKLVSMIRKSYDGNVDWQVCMGIAECLCQSDMSVRDLLISIERICEYFELDIDTPLNEIE